MPEPGTRRPLRSIQAARGLAALAVVFYHDALLFERGAGLVLFGGAGQYGYMGVPFFFVLSGFIIGYAHFADLGRPDRLRRFLRKRFLRVYPLYWVLSALFILAALAGMGEPDFSYAPAELAQAHLLIHFLPSSGPPPLKVAWTLFYEVRFYLVFALAIVFPRATLWLASAWLTTIAALTPWNALSTEWLSYWNLAFPIGLLAYVLFKDLAPSAGPSICGVGIAAILAMICFTPIPDFHGGRSVPMVGMMTGFAAMILGLALVERERDVPIPRSLTFLGNASFSLYLSHSAVISLAGSVVFQSNLLDILPAEVLFLPIVVLAVVGGLAVHVFIEGPLLSHLGVRIDARRRRLSETGPEGSNPSFARQ